MQRAVLLLTLCAGLAGMAGSQSLGTVVLRNDGAPGGIRVENNGAATSLSSKLIVERFLNGQWIDTPVHMQLVEKCALEDPPDCIALPADAAMTLVPWRGYTCSGQCVRSCRSNNYAGPGTFRVVAKACGSKQRIVGPEFALPPESKP